ncbi:phage tail protein [Shewanella xiamenensis]|uniref:phage tail-collar fiber domain-containing protein n=1 Tax=Shewanella xiamenensis TaxID=332186 RepID=UPI002E7B465D|nr:phage tail protein [Shewanella xiamenensis]MEE1981343.1 phage tail protein [Shewanella xiamenensis]
MASVITIAGEQLFAAKAQANEQLDIDTFIFANVPNQDPSAPINREEGIPTAHIVYQQNVQQVGRINDNVVVYSTVLDSITGPFEFNWVGLYSSVNQKLVAINHVPTVTKTATAPGAAGNTLNRNFGIEYSGIAELTGITVEPETWQLDFTARLSGMDKLTQQLAADMNGKDWFIDDGLKVVPRATANSFSVTPGVGYVSGLRAELKQEHILIVQSYPQFVYVDAWFSGNANSTWSPQLAFTVTNTEMDDYIDPSGTQHYVYKLAVINAEDDVGDLRVNGLPEKYEYLDQDFAGFTAALLADASIVDNGQPDSALNSKRVIAIKEIIKKNSKSINLVSLGLVNSTTLDQSIFFNEILSRSGNFYIPPGLDFSIRFDHAISFTSHECKIDLGGATLIDNVQDRYIEAGIDTGASLLTNVGFNNCGFYNFIYKSLPTRAQGSNIPDADTQYWVFRFGAQVGDLVSITENFEFHTIKVPNKAEGLAGFALFIGDIVSPKVRDIEINGEWYFGVNFNWSIRPDWGDKGAVAHGIDIWNIKGRNNLLCKQFIGISGNYALTLNNCFGEDVNNFIYLFNGDLAQSRFNPSVTLNGCNHRIKNAKPSDDLVPLVINQRYEHPSLPVGDKLYDSYIINNSQFESNGTSYIFRNFGTKGKTTLNNCRLYGGAPIFSTGMPSEFRPDRVSDNLTFRDCVLEVDSVTDIMGEDGVLFENCKIILNDGFTFDDCKRTKFVDSEIKGDLANLWVKSSCEHTIIRDCHFDNDNGSKILLQSITYGGGNTFVNDPIVRSDSSYGVIGDPNLSSIDLAKYGTSGAFAVNGKAFTTFISEAVNPVSGTVTINDPQDNIKYSFIKATTGGVLSINTIVGGPISVGNYTVTEFIGKNGAIYKTA